MCLLERRDGLARHSAQPPEHCSAGAVATAVECHFAYGCLSLAGDFAGDACAEGP